MQQYFVDEELQIGDCYVFTKEQAHHAKTVVRLDHERVRLVSNGKAFFAEVYDDHGTFVGKVLEKDDSNKELETDIVLAISLIKRDKFELVLQKATELGVKEIIPVLTSRCVVKVNKDKRERYETILLESAQQCKRNMIPMIHDTISLKELMKYKKEINIVAYENEEGEKRLSSLKKDVKSILYFVGPEGGFSEEEITFFKENDFECVSLGDRILRAETAAIYGLSVLGELYR